MQSLHKVYEKFAAKFTRGLQQKFINEFALEFVISSRQVSTNVYNASLRWSLQEVYNKFKPMFARRFTRKFDLAFDISL